MKRIIILTVVLAVIAVAFACGDNQSGVGEDTPAGAYKRLYAAVKSKDTERIKSTMSVKTIEFGKMAAARNNTPLEKMYENGFTATTFSPTLPEIRDPRIKDDMASVEVWNSKDSRWEDLPFVREDGVWKLAVGDLFAGTFKSPGPGRDAREKEAANASGQGLVPAFNGNMPNINANATAKVNMVIPKPANNGPQAPLNPKAGK